MKKRVLLLGNTSELSGVKVDLINYQRFFLSNEGGAWHKDEVVVKLNPSLIDLRHDLDNLAKLDLDYLIVVFSGHGGWERSTILEINKQHEEISEKEIAYISRKQLTILDCCRGQEVGMEKTALREHVVADDVSKIIRNNYEKQLMKACDQHILLYACKIGQYAVDSKLGGIYSNALLKSATTFSGQQFKTIVQCHNEATLEVERLPSKQNPEALLPRCLNKQQLIFSINPMSLLNLIR